MRFKKYTYGRWSIANVCKGVGTSEGRHFWHMSEKPWLDVCVIKYCGKVEHVVGRLIKNGKRISYLGD